MAGIDWYSAGTIAVANGGAVVTGGGTNWLIDPQFNGAGILLPDGLIYEITDITSATALNIKPNYKGTSVGSGGAYQIAPIQGWARQTAMQITTLMAEASDLLALVPANKDIIQSRDGAWTTRTQAQYSYDIFTGPPELNVASAAICDIGLAISHRVQITGTTTITSMGTVPNCIRYVRFGGVVTIVYNPVSLILPGQANIQTRAGDNAIFTSDSAGNWRCIGFVRVTTPVQGGDYFWDENLAHGVKATNINTGPLTSVAFTASNGANVGELVQTGTDYAPTVALAAVTPAGDGLINGLDGPSLLALDGPDTTLLRGAGVGGMAIFATGTPVRFGTSNAERMQLTPGGHLSLAGTTELRFRRINDGIEHARIFSKDAGAALAFEQGGGNGYIAFFASGAGFGANAERMRIDAAGNVGIGNPAPFFPLDIQKTVDGQVTMQIENLNNGANARAIYRLKIGGSLALLQLTGPNYTPAGIDLADTLSLFGPAAGVALTSPSTTGTLRFNTNGVERMKIDGNGKVGIGVAPYPSAQAYIRQPATNSYGLIVEAQTVTPSVLNTSILGNPNDTVSRHLLCSDGAATRAVIYSNGGFANVQANDTNISDAAVKTDITPYDDAALDALETSFIAVDWGRFKFSDQTHDDWNHGYTAQGVEAAFATSAPELVDQTEMGPKAEDGAPPQMRKTVYAADLANISHALLARALKRIAQLETHI